MKINIMVKNFNYDKNGENIHETIYNPAHYAELYLEGKITREQFLNYIDIWKRNSNEYLYKAYE